MTVVTSQNDAQWCSGWTPERVRGVLDEVGPRMDNNAQYRGDEPNAWRKHWDCGAPGVTVRWLVTAPWPYQSSAGNESVPSVYKALNIASARHLADRFYLPETPRDLRSLAKRGCPVFGTESKQPMDRFTVVSTSIAYPILFVNFAAYLYMSGIPIRASERAQCPERWPFVLIGGQGYSAPESSAPIADAWFCGEAETELGRETTNPGVAAVSDRIGDFVEAGLWDTDRARCYRLLAREFRFLYFPAFYETGYGYEDRTGIDPHNCPAPSRQVRSWVRTLPGMRAPTLKRHIKNLDDTIPLDDPPVLQTDAGLGSGDLEGARGCSFWCSFCALSYRSKPYRQRSPEYAAKYAREKTRNVGNTKISPYAPDFPVHTQRKRFTSSVLESAVDHVDGGAMRVDDFVADPDWMTIQLSSGMKDVTLGLEGGSQRLRDLVGKGVSDHLVCEAVSRGLRGGMKKFKLFMIAYLPGEDEGDVERVLELGRKLAEIRDTSGVEGVTIQFSWTPMMIEANTPLQWFAVPSGLVRYDHVWNELRALGIRCKLGSKSRPAKRLYFQAAQRASRQVGEIQTDLAIEIVTAKGPGSPGATWGGLPNDTHERLHRRLVDVGFPNGTGDVFDERVWTDLMGYEYVDTGVSPDLLWDTYAQMCEFLHRTDSDTYDDEVTAAAEATGQEVQGVEMIPSCSTHCQGRACGCCDRTDLEIRREYVAAEADDRVDVDVVRPVDRTSKATTVLARIERDGRAVQADADFYAHAVRRAFNRAQETFQFERCRSPYRWPVRVGAGEGDGGGNVAYRDRPCGACPECRSVPMVAKSVGFASQALAVRGWPGDSATGSDYLEFHFSGLRTSGQVAVSVDAARPGLDEVGIRVESFTLPAVSTRSLRSRADRGLYYLPVPEFLAVSPDEVSRVLERLARSTEPVMVRVPCDTGYFGEWVDEVDLRTFVADAWPVVVNGVLQLALVLHGRLGPPETGAGLASLVSERGVSPLRFADRPARRFGFFTSDSGLQLDMLRPCCEDCGGRLPIRLDGDAYVHRPETAGPEVCPPCADRRVGTAHGPTLAELRRTGA